MNDERLFERLAAHAGPADVDPGFEDSLYALLKREMGRTKRLPRPALLLVAALLLALVIGGAVLVGSGIVEPPVLPDGSATYLAYELDGDIYLADSDGGNPVRVADGLPPDGAPGCGKLGVEGSMWSPDGRYVAYRSDHWGDLDDPPCPGTVHLRDAAGQPVASFPGTGWLVSWSPDSTRVATWVEMFETIGIYGIDGARQALLTMPGECAVGGDFDPVWSPDGSSVVVPGQAETSAIITFEPCELPLDGRAPRRLPADDPRSRHQWSYSPDGASVAYVAWPVGDPVSLVVAAADGSNDRVLMSTGVAPGSSPLVWSPTGDRIAVNGGEPGSPNEVLVVDVASGTVTSLASARGNDVLEVMTFSPDGERILFTRRDALNDVPKGLWSVKVDGSDARLLVTGTDWGDWRPVPPGS